MRPNKQKVELPDLTGWKETLKKLDKATDELIKSRKEKNDIN